MKRNGFYENEIELITNAGQIDFRGEEHGLWGRIVRSIQHFGTEGKYLDRYEQELKDDHQRRRNRNADDESSTHAK